MGRTEWIVWMFGLEKKSQILLDILSLRCLWNTQGEIGVSLYKSQIQGRNLTSVYEFRRYLSLKMSSFQNNTFWRNCIYSNILDAKDLKVSYLYSLSYYLSTLPKPIALKMFCVHRKQIKLIRKPQKLVILEISASPFFKGLYPWSSAGKSPLTWG